MSSELRKEKIGKLLNSPFNFLKQYKVKPIQNKHHVINAYLLLLERKEEECKICKQ